MTNIFWFHRDPRVAALHHADVHIPKMGIEAAQVAATALRRNGYDKEDIYEAYPSPGDQRTHQEWATMSKAHTILVIKYGLSIMAERNRRWPERNPHDTTEQLRRQRVAVEDESVEWPNEQRVSNPPKFGLSERYSDIPYSEAYRTYAVWEKDYTDETFTATNPPVWVAQIEEKHDTQSG